MGLGGSVVELLQTRLPAVPRKDDALRRQDAHEFTKQKGTITIEHLLMTSEPLVCYDMFICAGEFK